MDTCYYPVTGLSKNLHIPLHGIFTIAMKLAEHYFLTPILQMRKTEAQWGLVTCTKSSSLVKIYSWGYYYYFREYAHLHIFVSVNSQDKLRSRISGLKGENFAFFSFKVLMTIRKLLYNITPNQQHMKLSLSQHPYSKYCDRIVANFAVLWSLT